MRWSSKQAFVFRWVCQMWGHSTQHPWLSPWEFATKQNFYVWKFPDGGFKYLISYFHQYLGMIPILTNIFEMGWNHQLDSVDIFSDVFWSGFLVLDSWNRVCSLDFDFFAHDLGTLDRHVRNIVQTEGGPEKTRRDEIHIPCCIHWILATAQIETTKTGLPDPTDWVFSLTSLGFLWNRWFSRWWQLKDVGNFHTRIRKGRWSNLTSIYFFRWVVTN